MISAIPSINSLLAPAFCIEHIAGWSISFSSLLPQRRQMTDHQVLVGAWGKPGRTPQIDILPGQGRTVLAELTYHMLYHQPARTWILKPVQKY